MDGEVVGGQGQRRRVDGHRRTDSGGQDRGLQGYGRHHEPDGQLRDARREGRRATRCSRKSSIWWPPPSAAARPSSGMADQVAGWFVPAVILFALLTFVAWLGWGPSPRSRYALITAVAVLIIACPCALGLATPMSIMVGVGRGAQLGVLIRDAEALERMEKVDTLVVDKTGTLTEGRPKVVHIEAARGFRRTTSCRSWRASSGPASILWRWPSWRPRRSASCVLRSDRLRLARRQGGGRHGWTVVRVVEQRGQVPGRAAAST